MRGLSKERWQEIDALFAAALEKDDDQRAAFLDAVCGDDAELRQQVESLLAAESAAGERLGDSAVEFAAPLLPGFDSALSTRVDTEHRPGDHIGVYRVLGSIGHGGMGTVYLAERSDGYYHRRVALKLVKSGMQADDLLARFRHERQILASLEHPNIARLYDGGVSDDGRPFLVMEYVDGRPIDAHCNEKRLPVDERLQLFRQVCEAVHHAHKNLVVHRDLKPSNILVTKDGTVKLLDFGIAKMLASDDHGSTTASTRLLTPGYASPEQVRGATVTTATDVYSLGVVLFELLTGRSPYGSDGDGLAAVVEHICHTEPRQPSAVAAGSPDPLTLERRTNAGQLARKLRGDLDNIILKALQKDPQRRYPSAEHLATDLALHLEGLPVGARPDTIAYRLQKWSNRHRGLVASAALVLVAIAAASLLTTSQIARVTMLMTLGLGMVLAVGLFVHAERARQTARRFQAIAEVQRAKAARVSAFLKQMLSSVSPEFARGRDTSLLRDILRGAARQVDVELRDQPAVAAELHRTIGATYRSLALYEEAEAELQKAAALENQEHDAETWAETQLELAHLRNAQGDYDRAIAILDRAQDVLSSSDARLRATYLSLRARVLDALGDYDAAERQHRSALQFALQAFEPEHGSIAQAWLHLGMFLMYYGRRDDAEAPLREAVRILRQERHRGGLDFLTALFSLATLFVNTGRYDEAERVYRELLDSAEAILDEDHPERATYVTGLATLRERQGEYEEAEALYRQALTIRERLFGRSHRDVATTWNNLGYLYFQWNRFDESDACYRRAIDLYEETLGADHPWLAYVRENHALVLLEKGEPEAAERTVRWCLDLPPERYERNPNFEKVCKFLLGACLVDLGSIEQGRAHLEEHHADLIAAYHARHPMIRAGVKRLAALRERAGDLDGARRLRTESDV